MLCFMVSPHGILLSLISFLALYLVISSCPSHTHPLPSACQRMYSVVLCCAASADRVGYCIMRLLYNASEDRVGYCIMRFRYVFMRWDIGVRRYVYNSVYQELYPRKGDGWMATVVTGAWIHCSCEQSPGILDVCTGEHLILLFSLWTVY